MLALLEKTIFSLGDVQFSFLKILSLLVPIVVSLYLGRLIIKLISKKLPQLWELFGRSRFLFVFLLRVFILYAGVSLGFKLAGIDTSILYYVYQLFFKPFVTIGKSPVSLASIVLLIFVISISVFLSKYIVKILDRDVYPKTNMEPGIRSIIDKFLKYFVITFGVVIGLQLNGIDLSVFATISAGLMVGVGFGLQNLASNFISGIVVLLERPIKVGDYVDVNGLYGRVDEINARSTLIRTRENIQLIVPNSKFISENVVNWSYINEDVLIQIPIGISYTSDPEKAKEILIQIAMNNEFVLEDPKPEVLLEKFADSSINMSLEVWIKNVNDRFEIISELNFEIYKRFKEENIHIPFPQVDVHLDK